METRNSCNRSIGLLLLLGLLGSGAVLGQEAYPEDAGDGIEPARRQELTQELAVRQQAIVELQSDQGIYSPALMEAYSDLGALYEELEDHENAARQYSDALQIARINTGLFSEQQLPIIDEMMESHQALRNWDRVDDLNHLQFHIRSRLYQRSDPRFLAAAAEFGSWRLRLIRENLLGHSSFTLMNEAEQLSEFYEGILADLDLQGDVAETEMLSILYGKTSADLAIARAVARMPYTAFNGTVSPYITQTRCRNVPDAQGQLVRQCYQVRVENPRYRQSQRQAKRMAVNRYSREVNESIAHMQRIRDTGSTMTADQRQQLESQIADLENASRQIHLDARGPFAF